MLKYWYITFLSSPEAFFLAKQHMGDEWASVLSTWIWRFSVVGPSWISTHPWTLRCKTRLSINHVAFWMIWMGHILVSAKVLAKVDQHKKKSPWRPSDRRDPPYTLAWHSRLTCQRENTYGRAGRWFAPQLDFAKIHPWWNGHLNQQKCRSVDLFSQEKVTISNMQIGVWPTTWF